MLQTLLAGSLRRAMLSLVLASLLPALAIILINGFEARRHAVEDARHAVIELAHHAAEKLNGAAAGIRLSLTAISMDFDLYAKPSDSTARFLSKVVEATPYLADLSLAGPDGNILMSAKITGEAENVADLPYFKHAMTTGRFTAGEQQARTNGIPAFPFALPLGDEAGATRGMLIAPVLSSSFGDFLRGVGLPPGSHITLADRNGRRIFRDPEPEGHGPDTSLPDSAWRSISVHDAQGTFEKTDPVAGEMLCAFVQLRLHQDDDPYIYVVAGIPKAHILAPANAALTRSLLLPSAAAALAYALAWLLWRPLVGRRMDKLMAVIGRLGSGDLSARVCPSGLEGELAGVERSVDAMADAMAESERSRTLHEAALAKAGEELEERVRQRTIELSDANLRLKAAIAERSQARKELLRSERLHRALYEHSAAGVLLLDASGMILDANPAAHKLLGYSRKGLCAMPYAKLIHPGSLAELPVDLTPLVRGRIVRAERTYLTKRGDGIPVDAVASGVNENLIQIVFTDVSERKKFERLREDVERITRHDLKTPLLGVVQIPDLLLRSTSLGDGERELLHLLRESGYRMLNTINMSLVLYKMEEGGYACEPMEFDLLESIRHTTREIAPLASAKEVDMPLLLDGMPPGPGDEFPVSGEEHLCLTMLENLLRNAVEASPRGGRVEALLDLRAATLTIRNKGEVPPGVRDRFFSKYATEGKKFGTGLGTYSAKLIAATHGWNLRADFSVPGETSVVVGFKTVGGDGRDLA